MIIKINNTSNPAILNNKNNDIIFCQKINYIQFQYDDDYIGLILNSQQFNIVHYKYNQIIGIPVKIQLPLHYTIQFKSMTPGLKIDMFHYKQTFFNNEFKYHIHNGIQFYFKIYDINLIQYSNNLNFLGYIDIIPLYNYTSNNINPSDIYIITNNELYDSFPFSI